MRIFKKLIALTAVAACVLTMGNPLLAKADDVEVCAEAVDPGCHDGNHYAGREIYLGRFTSTTTHEYSDAECVITTIYDLYQVTCECGQVSYGTRQTTVNVIHSVCP